VTWISIVANGVASPADLLAAARAVLAGTSALPSSSRARGAAVLARTALEQIIDQRLAELEVEHGALVSSVGASGRVKLICLRALEGSTADRTAWAWSALSNACHHHSYELSPSAGEVGYLVAMVESVAGLDPDGSGDAPH
jgi:hypothetical protein